MRSAAPPKAARWLLEHFGCSPHNEAVIGDLDERYGQGQSWAWYWSQVLVAILFNGGRTMLKVAATIVVLALFATMLILMAHDGFFHPGDRIASLGMLVTIDVLILLALLTLRAVWRFSRTILRALYWPTVIATVVLGLGGTTQMFNGADFYLLRVGAYTDVICLLAAFSLWRTRKPVERV